MKKKGFTLIELITALAIIAVIFGICGGGILKVMNKQELTITVTDKGTKKYSNKDSTSEKYLIYTDETTYEITDSLFKWRWDSSDLYGRIQVGHTYVIETGGYRIPFLSMYQNIYKATEVEE